MTYVRQQDKRLCVQLRGPFECFFGFAAAKYQNQTVLQQGTISHLTYKIKNQTARGHPTLKGWGMLRAARPG